MPAPNDQYGSPTALSGASGSTVLDFTGADHTEAAENTWWGGSNHKSLWFLWTAPAAGSVTFTLSSGAPAEWDIAVGTNSADFATWAAGPLKWAWQGAPVTPVIDVTAGQVLRVMVDDYSYETGSAPTTAAVLSWTTPPPPAPTAGSWSSAPGRDFHTAFPGDDITITAGTNLLQVTTVTVGGVAQAFTANSNSNLTVHIDDDALSGPIVVSNSGGSDPADGDVAMRFYGPWIQPADRAAYASEVATSGYTKNFVISPTQPDLAGQAKVYNFGYTGIELYNAKFPDPSVDPQWQWSIGGALLLAKGDETYMPAVSSLDAMNTDPSAVGVDRTGEPLYGTAVSDMAVRFDVSTLIASEHVDSVDNKVPGDHTNDLFTTQVQYRRVPGSDWTYAGWNALNFTSGAWPSKTAIAAMALDFQHSMFRSGEQTQVDTEDDTGLDLRVDNRAVHNQSVTPPLIPSAVEITWAEFEAGVAWLAVLNTMVGTAMTVPYVDSSAVINNQRKLIGSRVNVELHYTYRPPRYRLIYTTKQGTDAGVLKVCVGTDWKDVGCGGTGPGRLKLWTSTGWVREACDGETAGSPLRSWDGTTWKTVACMVPE